MRIPWRYIISACLLVGVTSACGKEIKWQNNFKGMWILQSRTLSDGTRLESPTLSGRFEWFPTSAMNAHISYLATLGPDEVQIQGQHLEISGDRFTSETYLRAGGGFVPAYMPGFTTDPATDEGTFKIEAPVTYAAYNSGMTIVFLDKKSLEVRHSDGTVDRFEK